MKEKVEMKLLRLIGIVSLILVWWLISISGWIKPILLPPPQAVVIEVIHFVVSTDPLSDLFRSLLRILLAFALSILIGVPLGMILGYVKPLANLFEFPIDFFRSLPATALYPLFMLFFGVGDKSKLILVVFASSLVNLIYAMYGVRNCSAMRLKAARVMRLKGFKMFYRVIVPESLPNIVSGLRISLSLVLILVVVLEMFTGNMQGIGRRIYDNNQMFRIKDMYAAIVIVGILGYTLNKLVTFLDNKFVHWGGR